jgi:adenosylmethionine---8-amino-7-oxononanoate aminotransferase
MSPFTSNQEAQARSVAHVWHPCTQMQRAGQVPPLPLVRGAGPWLFDADGARYFDSISSWWVNLFGHGDAGLNAAIKDQLDQLAHVMLAGCTHAPAVELAERLSALTDHVLGHCFFASDGASAVEIALKMAFHHWRNRGRPQKSEFVCLRQGYHGETLGALALTDVQVFRDAYDPLLMHAHQVMSPDARQALPGENPSDVAARALADLQGLLEKRHEYIAALIIEPLVQGAAGMAMHDATYLSGVRRLCDQYQVLLIADEIAVGCGRTGTFFAFEQAESAVDPEKAEKNATSQHIWPDLLCLSKGISGGFLPLSLVLCRDEIYQSFWSEHTARGFLHSHSYSGNALACRAALAVLDRFEQTDVLHQNRVQAAVLTQALARLARDDERIEHFRHCGMIWAFDVKQGLADSRFAERFHMSARRHELLIRPIGRSVYVMPPYVLTPEISAWLAQQVFKTLNATLNSTKPGLTQNAPSAVGIG